MLRWHPVLCQNVISISRWETRFEQGQQVMVPRPWRKWKRTWSWRARCSTRRSGRWRRGSPSRLPCSSTPWWSSWTAARFCFLLRSESETRWSNSLILPKETQKRDVRQDLGLRCILDCIQVGFGAWLESLGKVSWIVVASSFHTLSLPNVLSRFPEAKVTLRQIHPLLHCLVYKSLIEHSDGWNTPIMYSLNRWLSHKNSKILTKYLYSL